MTNDYKKQLGSVSRLALDGRLAEALKLLLDLSRQSAAWDVARQVEEQLETYGAMLRIMAEGVNDPGRADLIDTITAETLALAMRLARSLAMPTASEIYYSTARTTLARPGESIAGSVAAYRDEIRRLEDDFDSLTDPRRSARSEQMLRDIFNRIWVTHPLTTDDIAAVDELMSPLLPRHARASAISAMSLGHISYYDSRRLEWLLKIYIEYADSEPDLALRALIEAMVGMVRYRRRPLSKRVKIVLDAARDSKHWDKDFTAVAIELMRATDTERVSEKLKDGLMGAMKNIPPELREKIQKGDIDLREMAELNPEWEEDGDNNGINERLREIAEMQAEGSDVFMSSFSHMKRFPFFHELANWYLPFYHTNSAVAGADDDEGVMGSLLTRMPVLCDSDKYSLMLSLTSIPASQRAQLAEALKMQAEQMAESLSEAEKASQDTARRNLINKYVQNIYRVANLFRAKSDLFNPFQGSQRPNLLQIDSLKGNPASLELLETLAAFYFKSEFWSEAADAYVRLDECDLPDGRRSQKKGYAYERSNMYQAALEAYDEAEMLLPDSEWTSRRQASLLRRTGNPQRAAIYYKALSEKYPENQRLTLDYATTLLEAGRTEEAEKAFHKALYLDADSLDAMRGLAWSQFSNKKLDQAIGTLIKITELTPDSIDYQRLGYAHWANGNISEAVKAFRKATQGIPSNIEALDADIRLVEDILSKAGADTSLRSIITEILRLPVVD